MAYVSERSFSIEIARVEALFSPQTFVRLYFISSSFCLYPSASCGRVSWSHHPQTCAPHLREAEADGPAPPLPDNAGDRVPTSINRLRSGQGIPSGSPWNGSR